MRATDRLGVDAAVTDCRIRRRSGRFDRIERGCCSHDVRWLLRTDPKQCLSSEINPIPAFEAALVGLKASAIKQGPCILELANITPGVMELLRITHLTQMFSS